VSGFNLLGTRSLFKVQPLRLRIGAADADEHDAVWLEITVPCEPCSKMKTLLVPCGYNATRGHGGVTASVLRGGWLCVGDAVRVLPGWAAQNAATRCTTQKLAMPPMA
jgi:MOSC domain-containing protein YiiM